jgi:hypothetical protein
MARQPCGSRVAAVDDARRRDVGRTHKRVIALLVVATAALLAVALANAATTSRYDGKVKGAGSVSFRLTGKSVTQFRASVSVSCVSSSGGRSESYLLAPGKSAKLDKQGQFNLAFKQAKRIGGPFPLYKINARVRGKVVGRSSSGTVTVSYYKNQLVTGRLTLVACNSGNAKWTAKRR